MRPAPFPALRWAPLSAGSSTPVGSRVRRLGAQPASRRRSAGGGPIAHAGPGSCGGAGTGPRPGARRRPLHRELGSAVHRRGNRTVRRPHGLVQRGPLDVAIRASVACTVAISLTGERDLSAVAPQETSDPALSMNESLISAGARCRASVSGAAGRTLNRRPLIRGCASASPDPVRHAMGRVTGSASNVASALAGAGYAAGRCAMKRGCADQ
jgi:hypothetical protein